MKRTTVCFDKKNRNVSFPLKFAIAFSFNNLWLYLWYLIWSSRVVKSSNLVRRSKNHHRVHSKITGNFDQSITENNKSYRYIKAEAISYIGHGSDAMQRKIGKLAFPSGSSSEFWNLCCYNVTKWLRATNLLKASNCVITIIKQRVFL